jgi:hypothetical protein
MATRAQRPHPLRPAQITCKPPYVPGHDVAGIVEAVGADCRRLRAGDCVWGSALSAGAMAMGTFGEYVVLPEAVLDTKPKNLTFAEAASLGMVGLTSLQALKAVALGACASRIAEGAAAADSRSPMQRRRIVCLCSAAAEGRALWACSTRRRRSQARALSRPRAGSRTQLRARARSRLRASRDKHAAAQRGERGICPCPGRRRGV